MKVCTLDQVYENAIAQGFDNSRESENGESIRIKCSQCEALVINGIPTHEHGCPNQMGECRGCGNIVPRNVRYCEDCQ